MSCQGCERRTIGCHATCGDYAELRSRCDKRIEANRIENIGRGYVCARSKIFDKLEMKRRRRV